jgi:Co/Zn/Cd efflux system component
VASERPRSRGERDLPGAPLKHRSEDVNMSSVWECSRNDIVSNVCVFLAAGAVWLTTSGWPDLLVGSLLAVFLLRSSIKVMRDATRSLAQVDQHRAIG